MAAKTTYKRKSQITFLLNENEIRRRKLAGASDVDLNENDNEDWLPQLVLAQVMIVTIVIANVILKPQTPTPMDYFYETRRMKEYYQGLPQAAIVLPQQMVDELRQDIEDPDTEQNYRETMSFWAFVFLPFYNTLAYIVNNRFIHEELSNILADLDPHSPTLPPQSIYQSLLRLNSMPAEEFVRTFNALPPSTTSSY